MVPWSPTQKGKKLLCFSHYMSYCPARTQLGCGCLFHLQHLCILKNDFLVLLWNLRCLITGQQQLSTVLMCVREEKLEETGVRRRWRLCLPCLSWGLQLKWDLLGPWEKGFAIFHPSCAQLSTVLTHLFCPLAFSYTLTFLSSIISCESQSPSFYRIRLHCLRTFARGHVVYLKPVVETTQMTCF